MRKEDGGRKVVYGEKVQRSGHACVIPILEWWRQEIRNSRSFEASLGSMRHLGGRGRTG